MQKNKIMKIAKRTSTMLMMLSTISILVSCKEQVDQNYIDNPIALVYTNNQPFIINEKGDTYSLSYYDEVADAFDDFLIVKKNGHYGYIKNTGQEATPIIYDACFPMKEGKAVVRINGTTMIINDSGEVLYTFSENLKSESYFSSNHLVINDGTTFSYLIYLNDGTFKQIEASYDYASTYKEGYGVCAVYKQEEIIDENGNVTGYNTLDNLVYNYVGLNDQLLFDDYLFDFADSFSCGYARVGFNGSFNSYYTDSNSIITTDGLLYSYINEEGEYLHYNFSYEHTYIIRDRNGSHYQTDYIYKNEQIKVPFATSFQDGYAVNAIYSYSKNTKTFIKEYQIITLDGNMPYINAIYYATGYKYGYDDETDYRTYSPSQFKLNQLFTLSDIPFFVTGNTLGTSVYKFHYALMDEERGYPMFFDVDWELDEIITDDTGLSVSMSPMWMNDYLKTYFPAAKSDMLARWAASNPYDIVTMKRTPYTTKNLPIIAVRIINSNTYGLLQFEPTSSKDKESIRAYYLLYPIYDKIIY